MKSLESIPEIKPKNPENRWVTINNKRKVVSEGKTPDEALEKSKSVKGINFLMYVPIEEVAYVF